MGGRYRADKVKCDHCRNATPSFKESSKLAGKYRVGIIGCGMIANAHATGYKGLEETEIVAIADPVPEALDQFGDTHSVANRYTDAREMLDKEKLDIVSVCTWHKLHAPMTIAACARKPKAVLCEKPMATNMMECDDMMIAASRNNVKLAIGHQRRFNAAWNEGKRLIGEGAIGDVRLVFCSGTNQGLLNDATHAIDFMRYLLGDPDALWVMGNIQRKSDRYERDIRIEECGEGVICFDNGTIGLIMQELLWPVNKAMSPTWREGMGGILLGTEGILEVDERKVRLLSSRTGKWETYETGSPSFGTRSTGADNPFVAQAKELVDWIEGRVEHRGNAENGRAAVEIIFAIYESARMHECVKRQPLGSPLAATQRLPSGRRSPFGSLSRLVHTRISPLDLMVDSGQLPVERPGRYDVRAFLLKGEQMAPKETEE